MYQFIHDASERDLCVAMDGATVLGIGRIVGPYEYTTSGGRGFHRRRVEWLNTDEWTLPEKEGLQTTFVPLTRPANLVSIEKRIFDSAGAALPPPPAAAGTGVSVHVGVTTRPLDGWLARIESVLSRKSQVILHGPPGTGKTYWADLAATKLLARSWFGLEYGALDDKQKRELSKALTRCTFHPAYGYEDFLEGFRPTRTASGALGFDLRAGVFKQLCIAALAQPDRLFFLLIDEINRGDIPRIFGELLTVLEHDKRGRSVTLPLSGETFVVPSNIRVIGTMNTADRSIALLDAALRRRFGFIELLPDSSPLTGSSIAGLPLGPFLDRLNQTLVKELGASARDLQVGHAYFMHGDRPIRELGQLSDVLRDDVIPLLSEYCYEDRQALERILPKELLYRDAWRVSGSPFEPSQHPRLVELLLQRFPDLTATADAIAADDLDVVDSDEEDDADRT